jgi:hypothetical protein
VTTITTSPTAPQPERKKTRRHRHHRSGDRELKVEQKPQPKWKLPGAFSNRR